MHHCFKMGVHSLMIFSTTASLQGSYRTARTKSVCPCKVSSDSLTEMSLPWLSALYEILRQQRLNSMQFREWKEMSELSAIRHKSAAPEMFVKIKNHLIWNEKYRHCSMSYRRFFSNFYFYSSTK